MDKSSIDHDAVKAAPWAIGLWETLQKRKDELVQLDGRSALISMLKKVQIEYSGKDLQSKLAFLFKNEKVEITM